MHHNLVPEFSLTIFKIAACWKSGGPEDDVESIKLQNNARLYKLLIRFDC